MKNNQIIAYTDKSIGTLDFKNLCRYMKDRNQTDIIITDVDIFEDVLNKVNNKEENYNLNIDMAIEISTGIRGINLIVFDVNENEISIIQNYIDEREKNKQQLYRNIINSLKEKFDITIDEKEILDYSSKPFLTKIGIARVLFKKGRAITVNEAITKYIDPCINYEDLKYEYEEDIKLLEKLGKKIYLHCYDSKTNNNIDGYELINNKTFADHHVEEI